MPPSLHPFLKYAVDIVFPPQCLSCHALVGVPGNLCQECWETVHFITDPQCVLCGMPFEAETASGTMCGQCIQSPPKYSRAKAVFVYDDASRSLVTSFKYGDKTHACKHFAKWMARAGTQLLADSDVIIPVPLHSIRLFLRRYNQSSLLASEIGKIARLPVYHHALIRTKNTPPQAGLPYKKRIRNVKSAFRVPPRYEPRIAGARILLIDDVMTTGSTVNACSKTLLRAGAADVKVLTLATTVR